MKAPNKNQFSEDEIKKIAYNCRQATYLVEKNLTGKISIREKLELKLHLAGCSACRIYEQQSINLNSIIKKIFRAQKYNTLELDTEFKKIMQDRLQRELNKQ